MTGWAGGRAGFSRVAPGLPRSSRADWAAALTGFQSATARLWLAQAEIDLAAGSESLRGATRRRR